MNITYPKLGAALNATGRQIFFTCSWPVYETLGIPGCNASSQFSCLQWPVLTGACNSWRIYKDIMDTFYLPGHAGVRNIIELLGQANATLAATQRPGAYNDADMLLAGNNGLSDAEVKIQFGMWSMWSAPLLMSNDLRQMPASQKEILLNPEVIAVTCPGISSRASGERSLSGIDCNLPPAAIAYGSCHEGAQRYFGQGR
eukprot:COSAG01_NODE_1883_length_8988_cov_67.877264_7_plen_200_part_00